MRRTDFSRKSPGMLVTSVEGNLAYVPAPLPPIILWNSRLVNALAEAAAACGALEQAATRLGSDLLIGGIGKSFQRKEAELSSRIEGTRTKLLKLFLLEDTAEDERTGDELEVTNYLKAQAYGLERIQQLPLSQRLIKELHERLLDGVRGGNKAPGQFRRSQVHIGRSDEIEEARYVPPPPPQMQAALDDLERYLHAESELHPLIRMGLVHYQFEAIHPFNDGNGRIGRLLIILMLGTEGILSRPLIYPSAYIERNREEYYDGLLAVSTHGEWERWLIYFLTAIGHQAREALQRCQALVELHGRYMSNYQQSGTPAMLLRLLEELFQNPFVTVNQVKAKLGCSYPTARDYIQRLIGAGVLTEFGEGQRNRRFYAKELFDIIDA